MKKFRCFMQIAYSPNNALITVPCRLRGGCERLPYDTLLPVGRHYIGKDETVAIGRVNSRLRHWFARFRPVWCRKRSRWSTPSSHCLPPITSIEQRQNSPCHWLLNTLVDEGLAGFRQPFIVFGQTSISSEPCECSFNNPPAR